MPAKKINFKKLAAGTLLVGAPVGATLGVVYGTKDKATERQDLPVVTFGDKYFNAVIKDDSSFAPSHVLSPEGGNNLYSSYIDLLSANDIDHYIKIIKQKPAGDGGGPAAPLYTKDVDITDCTSIEQIDKKFLEVNDKLNHIAVDFANKHPGSSLGLVTAPLIKDKKRVIQVIAYEMEQNTDLTTATKGYFGSHFHFDVNNTEDALKAYIGKIDARAGADGFDWSKDFMQILLSKTIADNNYFKSFGINDTPATGDNEIKVYKLKYASLPNGNKVPVKVKDDKGEHFVLTPFGGTPADHPIPSASKDETDSKIIKQTDVKTDERLFDSQIRDVNGDYDFEGAMQLSDNMLNENVIPQIEASIDWKSNEWFFRTTFNKVDSDSIIVVGSTIDVIKNPTATSLKTIKVPLSHFGKPISKAGSAITIKNLKAYDLSERTKLADMNTKPDSDKYEELAFNSNRELMGAVKNTIDGLNSEEDLYELFRNAFLGKPGSKMRPQFSHYLKRNLISDGLGILGQVMPGILGPVNSFKTVIKMIETQKASFEKINVNGVDYQGEDFLRKVVFSNDNIKAIFEAMDRPDSSTNGISFIYNSIIKFGIAEQRTPGVLSQGTKNENGAKYITQSSNDWLWSSISKITELSATKNPEKYSLYNLYSLFSGLNIIDEAVLKTFSANDIKKTSEVDNGDSVISTLFDWANKNEILPEGTTVQTVISDVAGTVKKLIVNLYNINVKAREDEANGLPIAKRHKFVAFPTSLIGKVITLIPGVDWTKIQEKETDQQRIAFVEFVKNALQKDDVDELKGDSIYDVAKHMINVFESEGIKLPKSLTDLTVNIDSTSSEITKQQLRLFVTKLAEGDYIGKLSLSGVFSISSDLKALYITYDPTVLRGYLIPDKLPEINPQEDVRKAAVSILGDPYTLISLFDTIKGSGITIEEFMNKLIPDSSFDVSKMIPTLIETLTSKHNLDILTIDRLLNVVSRMGLLPSIADKILSPSVISTASNLIGDGRASEIYKAFMVIYKTGLYNYFNGATGQTDFERDLSPVISSFMTKLKLIPEAQYNLLSDDAKKTSVSDKQFEDAIFDILENGIGDSSHKISPSLETIGKVASNTLELPSSMIDIPKLVEAVKGILEDGSIKSSLEDAIKNTDTKNPTPFQYLFDMLHDSGSTIIYSMLPDSLKTAMDAFPTKDLMEITQHLLYGFKTEPDFVHFLTFIKGLLPKDASGKTILDKKLSELDDSVPKMVDIATTDTVEQLLIKAYNGKALISLGDFGKAEISRPISEILHNGLISDPTKIAADIYSLVHSDAPAKILFLTVYHLKIFDLLPENIKTMVSGVLGTNGKNLESILQVAKDAIEHPLNEITSDDVEKILNVVKIFMPNLNVSNELVEGIFFILHHGLNAGYGSTSPLEASKEVDKLLGAINSVVKVPDMLMSPIKNFMIGKDTFSKLATELATDIETTLNNHPFATIKHTTGEFDEIKNEIDGYNNLVDSIETYRNLIQDMPSLKATDPQTLMTYKNDISKLISELTKMQTKVNGDIHDQSSGAKDIKDITSDINKILTTELTKVIETTPELLTGTYISLDGKEHKYSEFNTYELNQWKTMKQKVADINKQPVDTLAKIKAVKAQLEDIYAAIQVTQKIPATFNGKIQKAIDAFNAYKAWMTATTNSDGRYTTPHNTDPAYLAIMHLIEDQLNKLKASVNIGNVLLIQDDIKAAYKAFNDQLIADKKLTTTAEAIKSLFASLSSEELKGIASLDGSAVNVIVDALSDSDFKDLINKLDKVGKNALVSKLSAANKNRALDAFTIISGKIEQGFKGIETETANALAGKSINWILDNVRFGYDSGFLHHTGALDLFGQNTKANDDSDVRSMAFQSIRTFSFETGWFSKTTHRFNEMDGSSSSSSKSPSPGRFYVLKNGNHGHNTLSAGLELLTLLQHVYSKDFNWLIDNGWI